MITSFGSFNLSDKLCIWFLCFFEMFFNLCLLVSFWKVLKCSKMTPTLWWLLLHEWFSIVWTFFHISSSWNSPQSKWFFTLKWISDRQIASPKIPDNAFLNVPCSGPAKEENEKYVKILKSGFHVMGKFFFYLYLKLYCTILTILLVFSSMMLRFLLDL